MGVPRRKSSIIFKAREEFAVFK